MGWTSKVILPQWQGGNPQNHWIFIEVTGNHAKWHWTLNYKTWMVYLYLPYLPDVGGQQFDRLHGLRWEQRWAVCHDGWPQQSWNVSGVTCCSAMVEESFAIWGCGTSHWYFAFRASVLGFQRRKGKCSYGSRWTVGPVLAVITSIG